MAAKRRPQEEVAPADVEVALLTKVCSDGVWDHVVRSRVTSKHFVDFDNRQVFEWLGEQVEAHDEVPSLSVLLSEFPDFKPEISRSSQIVLIDRIQDRRSYAEAQRHLQEVVSELKADPKKGIKRLVQAAEDLSACKIADSIIDTSEGMDVARKRYEQAKESNGIIGIPWPWVTLNNISGGAEDGAVYAFYGPEGTMKTWLVLFLAHYFQVECCREVGFFTFEMPKEDILCRYAAMRAEVEWSRFRNGSMNDAEESRFYEHMEKVKSDTPFKIIELSEPGAGAIASIRSHIKEHKLRAVVIDGLSFITAGLDWETFGEMNLAIKKLALQSKIPFVVTHHSNRTNKKINKASNDSSDVALGSTLARYVSLLIRLVRELRQEENDEVVLTLPKVRDGKRKIITLNAKPAFDFSEKYGTDPTELAEHGVDVGDDGML